MYNVFLTDNFKKRLKSVDKKQSIDILEWIRDNIDKTDDPKSKGKELKGDLSGYWAYTIDDYRIVADINADINKNEFKIILITVGHRKNIYNILKRTNIIIVLKKIFPFNRIIFHAFFTTFPACANYL
ncbi:type II toxin-antitoxin system RelE/ParE family toxin [Commensalibacter melissae]|uniref:type II toxin-antitoxin system RelE/ParE family toxin n=1 Tax=Commensalibacter melissae TaxID=2070537 RepID=UPI001325082C|nr:hypothetical protein [Commensalibacter melissae]